MKLRKLHFTTVIPDFCQSVFKQMGQDIKLGLSTIDRSCLCYFFPEEIRLDKFQDAVDDCNHVLSMEPKNVKGIAVFFVQLNNFPTLMLMPTIKNH